ncbi:MAG: MinD/ParA family protein [Phycisphaerae bacterium]|nr:MinD/ParA family protein [Phycisphaerae bacterium]
MVRHDDSGDLRDQASRLRRMMAGDAEVDAARRSAHALAVVSGKGGVGKTFVASNLAIALAARGHRTILFDMDMGLANADIVLGVEPVGTWSDVLSGRRALDEIIVEAPGHVSFVPGCSGVTELANLSEFERHRLLAAMRRVEARYDVMVLDCGAGISRNVVAVADLADTVLVLATPEPTALTDAYAMIKTFAQERQWGSSDRAALASIGLVVNNAISRREGRDTYERLAGVAARFLHLPVADLGYILRDDHVPAAVRQRRPVILGYPRCSASSCLLALAGRLSREMGRPEASQSLFYRVINLFV